MKKHAKERIRANRSAKSTVNQTQNPAPDPKRRLVYVKVPKSWLPSIDKAAAAMGHSRTSFFTEAVRAAIEAGKDAIIDRQHQTNAGMATVDQVSQTPATVPDRDLDLARAHCSDQMMRAVRQNADCASADLCAFSVCIAHHPGLRKEYQAFKKLGSGLLKIVNLSVVANEKRQTWNTPN